MKTPEEMAEEYTKKFDDWELTLGARGFMKKIFLACYHSRDEEVEQLHFEIEMLRAELRGTNE